MILTPFDRALLAEIIDQGGQATSLYALAARADLHYPYTHRRARRLAGMGCICINQAQGQGRPLHICAACLLGQDCDREEDRHP